MMKVLSIDGEVIDGARAAQILDEFSYPRQRKVVSAHVDLYARMMQQGEWYPGSEIQLVTAPNGDGALHTYLINGQHRLHAVAKADVPIEFTVKWYEADTQDEVAKLYGAVDTGRVRNINDLLRASDVGSDLGLTPTQITYIGAASLFLAAGCKNPNRYFMTPEQRIETLLAYLAPGQRYLELISGIDYRGFHVMKRRAPMAVALATLNESIYVYGDDKVEDFWRGIAMDDGLGRDDPRKVAVKHLRESYVASSKTINGVSPNYSARYIAACFAAWVENRNITYTRVADALAPICIPGTQWNGKAK